MYEEKKTNYWMITVMAQWILISILIALLTSSMANMREQMNDIRSAISSSQKEDLSMQEEMRQFMDDNKDWQLNIEHRMKKGLETGEW